MSSHQTPSEPSATDHLISALLAESDEKEGRLALSQYEPEVALLIGKNTGVRILVLTPGPAATREAMRAWLPAIVGQTEAFGPIWHVIAVGGPEVAQALKHAMADSLDDSRGYYYLGESGDIVRLSAVELPLILRAAYARHETRPWTSEQFAAALADGQTLQRTAEEAAAGLQARYHATAVITAVCVALMGLELLWMDAGALTVFAAMGANNGAALQQGEVWRLFASAFLHGNIVHLIVNMLALWSFGVTLESLLGVRRYLLLYGASALGGSLASALLGPGTFSVGASGAIWGLMAAGLAVAYWPRDLLPDAVVTELRRRAWLPLIFNIGYSLQPGIDVFAHLGGGVVGFVLIAAVLTRGLKPVAARTYAGDAERGPTPGLTVAAGAVGLAMAVSVVVALAVGRPWRLDDPLVFERTTIGATGFAVDLPGRIARVTVTDSPPTKLYTFGHLPESPVALEFIVLETSAAPQDIEALLEHERQGLDKVSPPDFVRAGHAERIMIGDRPVVRADYKLNDLSLRMYVVVFDRHEALIRRYVLGEMPPTWVGVEERAVASIGPEPAR